MNRGFADLDSAFERTHGETHIDDEVPESAFDLNTPKDGFQLSSEGNFDIETTRATVQDPETVDWSESPIGFRTFCEADEHMDLLPRDWEADESEDGALSKRQYEDCLAILGDDPKKMFDPKTRKYVFGCLLWAKGCIGSNTLIFDEETKKIYTVKEIVDKKLKIAVKSYDEKNNCIVVKKVARVFSKGSANRLKFTLKSGKSIIVSPDHRFKTKDGWIRAGDLKNGNKIAVKKD